MRLAPTAHRAAEILRGTAEAVLSLLYPPHCAACNADTSPGSHLCSNCGRKARLIKTPFCARCSQPFDGVIEGVFTCSNCSDRGFHFQSAVSRYASEGVVRDLIHRFKYEGHFYLRHQLAQWLAASLDDERIRSQQVEFLVPVPLHARRLREREFNQAEVLAGILGKQSATPILKCLKRIRYTFTQTRLDRHERMENLRGAFKVSHTSEVRGRHLLLVDDVFTTGSTVDECARVLTEAGARSVRVVTVARG